MKFGKLIAMSVIAASLAGCQGFPIFAGATNRLPAPSIDTTSYFAQLVDEGRLHLRANRPGQAINSFRRASYHVDYAGEAYNGMAVAYQMLGRGDLAERFFLAAIEADPLDGRFSRNLARFERSRVMQQEGVEFANSGGVLPPIDADVLAEVSEQLPDVTNMPDTLELPSRVQRVSPREIVIGPRSDWTSRLVAGEAQAPAVIHLASKGQQSLEATDSPTYPVSFAISDIPRSTSGTEDLPSSTDSAFVNSTDIVTVRVSGRFHRRETPVYPISFTFEPG